ncbi:DUF4082 domain-containing protein [Phytomonospora endophytica]|uniref:DUF4082 domain-containing protein n=1 Tax=Phytomonospora endophytica TaxID=714109 RepID=A0A841FWM7_9ACTN|nr:DUF4082 domain-containing protein [Phytomonospora endophytica]MBB6036380.1 hypothetical protein [Phytomonospora endophytica]GIG65701.1 hypothetical protein Pen01_19960 [Phytomonospora endophytica]
MALIRTRRSLLTALGAAFALLTLAATPAAADPVSYQFWDDATPDHSVATFDTDAVNLITRFTVDVPGTITAVRFYKADGNERASGDRVVSVFQTATPSLGANEYLAAEDETDHGWQTVALTYPMQVQPGMSYSVSYTAFGGVYAYTYDYFADGPLTVGPLTAQNSAYLYVYRYDENGDQLTGTWRDSSYWVDPVFVPAA